MELYCQCLMCKGFGRNWLIQKKLKACYFPLIQGHFIWVVGLYLFVRSFGGAFSNLPIFYSDTHYSLVSSSSLCLVSHFSTLPALGVTAKWVYWEFNPNMFLVFSFKEKAPVFGLLTLGVFFMSSVAFSALKKCVRIYTRTHVYAYTLLVNSTNNC